MAETGVEVWPHRQPHQAVEVVAVDRDPDAHLVQAVRDEVTVVVGDARLPDTQELAGLARAHALIAATGDDAVNLGVALAAREARGTVRVAVRLFDADFARKAQSAFKLEAALSASLVAAPAFAAAALYRDVCGAFVQGGRLFVARHCRPGEWTGLLPSQLQERHAVTLLMRRRLGEPGLGVATDDGPLLEDEQLLVLVSRRLGAPELS